MSQGVELLEGHRLFLADSAFGDLVALQWLAQSFDCLVIGTAESLADATDNARHGVIDAAILDTTLSGQPTHIVANLLRQRDIPIVFTAPANVAAPQWINEPLLRKPFRRSELANALMRVLGTS